jgi:hypothetical protein
MTPRRLHRRRRARSRPRLRVMLVMMTLREKKMQSRLRRTMLLRMFDELTLRDWALWKPCSDYRH